MISSLGVCTHPATRMFLKNFGQMQSCPPYAIESILPKGETEIIFSFAEDLPFQLADISGGRTPRCFINGISSIPVRLHAPAQQFFFGVVLQPAAVKKLLATPAG